MKRKTDGETPDKNTPIERISGRIKKRSSQNMIDLIEWKKKISARDA